MKQAPKLVRDMFVAVGSSGVAFLLALVATPIMTRFYAPEAYGVFGILNKIAVVSVGIGMFSLPNVVPLEKDETVRQDVTDAMVTLVVGLVLLAILVLIASSSARYYFPEIQPYLMPLAILPLLIALSGVQQIVSSFAVAYGAFTAMAMGRAVQPVVSRAVAIGSGALFWGAPAFILLAEALGNAGSAYAILRRLPERPRFRLSIRRSALAHVARTLAKFRDFSIYGSLANLAPLIFLLTLQGLIAGTFSIGEAGRFGLATSIIALPVTLVALATASIVYHRFIDLAANRPSELFRSVVIADLLYILVGLVGLSPVFFFGQELFSFAFGEKWARAGAIAGYLAVPQALNFGLVGVQAIFKTTRSLSLQFSLEVSTSLVVFATLLFLSRTERFETVIVTLACLETGRQLILHLACWFVAYRFAARHAEEDLGRPT